MATTKLLTVEDLERDGVPEGRYELIDGELVEMSPSGGIASKVAAKFAFFLLAHVVPRRLGAVFSADGGFVIFPGRELIRVPDAAFVSADRLPPIEQQEGFLRLAPDLVVEVISPSDRMSDVMAKVMMWLDAGVRLVWLADPRLRTVTIFGPDRRGRVVQEGELLDGGDVLPGFSLAVAELFA